MRDKQKALEWKQPRAQAAMIPQSLVLTFLQLVQKVLLAAGGYTHKKKIYLHLTRLAA